MKEATVLATGLIVERDVLLLCGFPPGADDGIQAQVWVLYTCILFFEVVASLRARYLQDIATWLSLSPTYDRVCAKNDNTGRSEAHATRSTSELRLQDGHQHIQ